MSNNLAEIIKANPGCVAIVDNDCWTLYKTDPYEADDDVEWEDLEIASSRAGVAKVGSGYGSGHCYGGDILQALAQIVGVKIQSV